MQPFGSLHMLAILRSFYALIYLPRCDCAQALRSSGRYFRFRPIFTQGMSPRGSVIAHSFRSEMPSALAASAKFHKIASPKSIATLPIGATPFLSLRLYLSMRIGHGGRQGCPTSSSKKMETEAFVSLSLLY